MDILFTWKKYTFYLEVHYSFFFSCFLYSFFSVDFCVCFFLFLFFFFFVISLYQPFLVWINKNLIICTSLASSCVTCTHRHTHRCKKLIQTMILQGDVLLHQYGIDQSNADTSVSFFIKLVSSWCVV